ncbi:MAG: hypothetical protein V3574_05515 [Candidatus Moraniibacteriota bacterium]
MKIKTKKIILFVLFLGTFFLVANNSEAENMPLQIINIKPAGTGSPAIPSTHRIFYAYPGIEYKIRAAVIGGDYPYAFVLSNAPSGMIVNEAGYIIWSNPQENANNVGLRVTDSNGDYVDTTWSISVQTSGFKFVDCTSGTNGNGTIFSPYDNISNMVADSSTTDLIYFRNGTCVLPTRGNYTLAGQGTETFSWRDPSNAPNRWLSFPDEEVTIDMNEKFFYGYPTDSQAFYFDGIKFYNAAHYFFRDSTNGGSMHYLTFLDCTFDTIYSDEDENRNMGGFFTGASGSSPQEFMVWQGNTFANFRNAHGIGSLYGHSNFLIENNRFSNFSDYDGVWTHKNTLAVKVGLNNVTIRGNDFNTVNAGAFGSTLNSPFYTSDNIEICYNLFRDVYDIGRANTHIDPTYHSGEFWIHHNTFTVTPNYVALYEATAACGGPYADNYNVYQNPTGSYGFNVYYTSGNYQSCISSIGNIGAVSGVVEMDGKLTPSYNSYVGTTGWQLSDGRTPFDLLSQDEEVPLSPTGLSVL